MGRTGTGERDRRRWHAERGGPSAGCRSDHRRPAPRSHRDASRGSVVRPRRTAACGRPRSSRRSCRSCPPWRRLPRKPAAGCAARGRKQPAVFAFPASGSFIADPGAGTRRLAALHPNLQVDLTIEDRSVSFEDREADLAVRLGRGPEDNATIRRLGPPHLCPLSPKGERTSDLAVAYGQDYAELPRGDCPIGTTAACAHCRAFEPPRRAGRGSGIDRRGGHAANADGRRRWALFAGVRDARRRLARCLPASPTPNAARHRRYAPSPAGSTPR